MDDNSLKIECFDPRGKAWDLTSGRQGAFLSMEQSDFDMSPIDQIVTAAGTHIATQRDSLQPSLAVDVGSDSPDRPTATSPRSSVVSIHPRSTLAHCVSHSRTEK